MNEPNDILPAPIHKTLRAAIMAALTDRRWIETMPSIVVFHDRDGGYFLEGMAGSPPLGHDRLRPGAMSAIIRKENDTQGVLRGLHIRVYTSHLDGSIQKGVYCYQDGTLVFKP